MKTESKYVSKRIWRTASLLLIVFSAINLNAQMSVQKTQIPFKEVGKMKVRKANEIKSSNLGVGCEVLDRDFASYDAYKDYLGKLGVKHARFQSGWAKTEKQKGVYDFKWLDAVLDDCLSKSIQPWVCICYGNPIYPDGGDEQSSSRIPVAGEALQAWLKYVEKLVTRNKDKVFEWEVWNESDHRNFRGATAEEYAAFYMTTAKVIRSIQPHAKIVVGGMCSSGVTDYIRTTFDYMKSKGEIKLIDGITFHGYPTNPDATFKDNLELVAFVKQYGNNIVARQGETGAPSTRGTSGALSNTDFNEVNQAKWDLRRALGFIGNNIPFSLFTLSEFSYPGNKLNTKGKLRIKEDLSVVYAKQSYYSYQNLCSLFDSELLPTGRNDEFIQGAEKTASLYTFKDNGTQLSVFAYWDSSGKPEDGLNTVTVKINVKGYKFKTPVLIDVRTGIVYEIPRKVIQNDFMELPLYDSPLLLCDKDMLKGKKLL